MKSNIVILSFVTFVLCGIARGCSDAEFRKCIPGNFQITEKYEVNEENCKVFICVSKYTDQCPEFKKVAGFDPQNYRDELQSCKKLMADGATATHWSSFVLTVALVVFTVFVYV